jgi:UDP-N-acetylglucosamine--N-acetylmuramyl-(pentapeptide) pyrophosphoryl-undecaprenol N-acetylglucosamine transferase
MKVIIAGGGTGGHLFPAVAVGDEIKRQSPESSVLYAGASNGLEARWLPQHGYPYELMRVRGWVGKGPLTRLRALSEFAAAIAQGRSLIRRFGADLVVGAGGYASAPVAVAALTKRVPLILMEQNTRPGISNRILARAARKICVGFDEAAAALPLAQVVVSGNPVRSQAHHGAEVPGELEALQILVLGGSSGAHRLNLGVLKAFEIAGKAVINWKITHQTGEVDVGMVAEEYRRMALPATVVPFIDNMAPALSSATLIISRSGAMAVSEIALAGRSSILVPYPFHRDRQQEHNAQVLVSRGAARIVLDDQNLGPNLAQAIMHIATDQRLLHEMGRRARTAARPDAAATIARICFAAAGERRPA